MSQTSWMVGRVGIYKQACGVNFDHTENVGFRGCAVKVGHIITFFFMTDEVLWI